MPKLSNKKNFVVVRVSDDEDDIAIPQARTVRISNTGLNIIQTPRSPQKGAIPPGHVPSPVYEWHPSNDYDCETADYHLAEDEVENEIEEVPTVAAKVAAKRYPTSVSTGHICIRCRVSHRIGCSVAGMGRGEQVRSRFSGGVSPGDVEVGRTGGRGFSRTVHDLSIYRCDVSMRGLHEPAAGMFGLLSDAA